MLPRRFPSVELRDTLVGLGVFTRRSLRRGEIIGDVCGKVISDPTYDSPYCMELGSGRSLEPEGPFRYLNHSCDPNCEIFYYLATAPDADLPDRLWLKALRLIEPAEELTIDYAWPMERAIPCLCGASNCRNQIVAAEESSIVP
jgi:uncharacterized protein